jgi:RecA-family ATPase
MAGADENSAMEVGRFISMIDEARERTGCSSLILHHPAKNGLGYRGSGAIAGAADLLVVLSEDESVPGSLTLTYDDVKDFEEPPSRHFQLRRHEHSAIIYPSAMVQR